MNDNDAQLTEWTTTVVRSAGDARDAIEAAERAVERRNSAIRAAAEAGVSISTVVSSTGLSRADVYRIIDDAEQ